MRVEYPKPCESRVLIINYYNMKNLTVKQATDYITKNYGEPRHNIDSLVRACRMTAKSDGVRPVDMFFLMIENKPIAGMYTHSYGFHTGNGRHLIDTTASNYYQLERGLTEDEILILN